MGNYPFAIGLALAEAVETEVSGDGSDPLKGHAEASWLGTGFAGLGILITCRKIILPSRVFPF